MFTLSGVLAAQVLRFAIRRSTGSGENNYHHAPHVYALATSWTKQERKRGAGWRSRLEGGGVDISYSLKLRVW